jgi:hypothetical protein
VSGSPAVVTGDNDPRASVPDLMLPADGVEGTLRGARRC